MKCYRGFTLLELMIVVAIIACLSVITLPSLMKTLAKAKRTEAYLYLRTIAQAQKVYFAEHGTYVAALSGPKSIGWNPEGLPVYSYGFPGTQEGIGHIVGSAGTPASALSMAQVSSSSFTVAAAGKIYGETLDILTVDQTGKIILVQDALA